MCQLRILYPDGVEPWLPTGPEMETTGLLLTAPAVVTLLPRSQLAATWKAQNGQAIHACQIRAWANKQSRKAWIFVDESETHDSVLWLLGHELAHLELGQTALLQLAVAAPKPRDYLTSDDAHEAQPEEQFANLVGTALLGTLTGRPRALDRRWWRKRVRRLGICP